MYKLYKGNGSITCTGLRRTLFGALKPYTIVLKWPAGPCWRVVAKTKEEALHKLVQDSKIAESQYMNDFAAGIWTKLSGYDLNDRYIVSKPFAHVTWVSITVKNVEEAIDFGVSSREVCEKYLTSEQVRLEMLWQETEKELEDAILNYQHEKEAKSA